MFEFIKLNALVSRYLDAESRELLARAYIFGADAHEKQKRSSGEAYFIHPVAVACTLAEMRMDVDTIIAALLHDVVEDTEITAFEIQEIFGEQVRKLVNGVTKLLQIEFNSKAEQQAENFRKMLLAMVEDIRVIIIKLSDRLHNMTTLGPLKPEKRRRVALETLDIYAPIAHRLGMHHFKNEFEDLAFEAIYPFRYKVLKTRVAQARGHRKKLFEKLHESLIKHLSKESINPDVVQGREKRVYSIYKKMKIRGIPFTEIMDVYAFRVIANSRKECYCILGLVHELYKPIPGKFKDYIAMPKANGYQSLHTTLFGPYGIPIEIQIRTKEMDYTADRGVAAHWIYKSKGIASEKAQRWLQKLNTLQKQANSSVELIENVKVDLFPDEVYVFTPNGEIIELANGSTPVDFAFHIHSEIGMHCIASRVNRRLVPLSHKLKHGDSVEIMTSPTAYPNPAWLDFIKTGKAKSAIKLYMRNQENEKAYDLGKRLVGQRLKRNKLEIDQMSVIFQQAVASSFNVQDFKTLLILAGKGEIGCGKVANKIVEFSASDLPKLTDEETHKLTISIDGEDLTTTTFADCCLPIPGDHISGLLIPGRGLEVHRDSCYTLKSKRNILKNPDQVVQVDWSNNIKALYSASIIVEIGNYRGSLVDVASAINQQGVDIKQFKIKEADDQYGIFSITVAVENRKQLASVIRGIRRVSQVFKVRRGPVL